MAGSGNAIEISMTIDDAQAFKKWQRQQDMAAKYRKMLRDMAKDGKMASQQLAQGSLGVIRQLGAAATALIGIGGIVTAVQAVANQLMREVENIRSRQGETGRVQVEFGKVFAGLQRASGGLLPRQELMEKTLAGAVRAGIDPAEFAKTVETTLQAKGPETKEDVGKAIEAAEKVATYYPEISTEDRATMSGSVGDLTNAYKVSTEESIGLLQNVAQAARVEGPQFMAQNAAPAMAQMAMYGESPQFAGALFATTTAQTVDREGATSKLIDLKLIERLKEAFPEEKTGLKTGQERLAYLQSHPEFHKAFLEGGTILGKKLGEAEIGRSAGRPFLEDLMRKGSQADQRLQSFMKVVGGRKDWQSQHDLVKKEVESDPLMKLGRMQAQGKATAAQIQLGRTAEGETGVVRDVLSELMKVSGQADYQQKLSQISYDVSTIGQGVAPTNVLMNKLDELSADLKAPLVKQYSVPTDYLGISNRYKHDPTKATAEGLQTAEKLDEFISIIKNYRKTAYSEVDTPLDAIESKTANLINSGSKQDALAAQEELKKLRQRADLSGATSVGAEGYQNLNQRFKSLEEQISHLINVLKDNTVATKEDAQAKGGPAQAKQPLPKNSQASRRLDRRYGGAYGGMA